MTSTHYPSLYQVNTRVWLTELSLHLGRAVTLDDVPDSELDRFLEMGVEWIWLMSVWQTGVAGRNVSRANPIWRHEFEQTLPDLSDDDIPGSGFAITDYSVHQSLGGDAALARLRKRLQIRGLKLMLDFVPNHVGLDHPWIKDHPEYFITGTEQDLAMAPQNYVLIKRQQGNLICAYGRDPYFSGWPDTLQLNYANPATQAAMTTELLKIAGQCDGVRGDMAMLLLPEVFEKTWGRSAAPFWPDAIGRVREQTQGFVFLAEVYWDLEWTLQQQGFDYTYDKRLYDRLRDGHARPVREHLMAGMAYQRKLARFLENHDEPRSASVFPHGMHEAAAVITYLAPGLRFLHQGQLEGRLKRISPHLGRAPDEPVNPILKQFYDRLLVLMHRNAIRDGRWQLLDCVPAWEGNWTNDCYIAFDWQGANEERVLVVVNYSPHQSQCRIRLPFADLHGQRWWLEDQLSAACFHRDGDELSSAGLFVDQFPWQPSAFLLTRQLM